MAQLHWIPYSAVKRRRVAPSVVMSLFGEIDVILDIVLRRAHVLPPFSIICLSCAMRPMLHYG
jgi:hypothetical protein